MPGRQKSDVKREAILHAALAEFAERDFHEVLMEEVAARAGVGKGTLYRYFRTKEELFAAGVAAAMAEWSDEVSDLLAGEGPIEEILRSALTRMLLYFRGRRNLLTLIQRHENRLSPEARERWQRRRRDVHAGIRRLLDKQALQGCLAFDDTELAAEMLLGMFRAAILVRPEEVDREEEIAGRIVTLFLHGVQAPRGRTSKGSLRIARGGKS